MQRLKKRSQFQAVLGGEKISSTAHFVLHRCAIVTEEESTEPGARRMACVVPRGTLDQVWIGAMVPKRWAKRAVTRNAIKRQIYSVSSERASEFPVAAHIVRLRAGFERAQFASASSVALKHMVRQELLQLLDRMPRPAARPRP